MRLRVLALVFGLVFAAALPVAASASELIDHNPVGVRLAVDRSGKALLTYRARGNERRVLAWGAVNAIHPTRARKQVEFRLDYSGGWGTFRRDVWRTFKNACRPYDGPELQWLVTACKAPDGSYWAVQKWQRMLPNFGVEPTWGQSAWEIRLSHWSTDVPDFQIKLDWAYRRYHHLWGFYSYLDRPIFGFRSTRFGAPMDTFGRNVYLDTFNSAYGAGWKRENSFLTHNPRGNFCYGFYRHGRHPIGAGSAYRATIIGPGVMPDMFWYSKAQGDYDRALDLVANEEQKLLHQGDPLCPIN